MLKAFSVQGASPPGTPTGTLPLDPTCPPPPRGQTQICHCVCVSVYVCVCSLFDLKVSKMRWKKKLARNLIYIQTHCEKKHPHTHPYTHTHTHTHTHTCLDLQLWTSTVNLQFHEFYMQPWTYIFYTVFTDEHGPFCVCV